MNNIAMFVTDLDGTLLNTDKKISDSDILAIRRFTEIGGIFTVATGRTEDTCRLATDLLPINAPVILYNGATVIDLVTKEILYRRTLWANDYRPLLREIMTRYPDVCIELFAFGPLMLVNPNAVMDPYIQHERQPYSKTSLEDTPEEWLKIMFSATHDRLIEVQAFVEARCSTLPDCTRFFSADYYYEIVDVGCSKGECVRFLAQRFGISQAQTAAIGDHLNDLEMLRWCRHSFAPANAHPVVKKTAHVLTASSDCSAVAEALAYLSKNTCS